jgi:nanoRNase/pAp phosphatase (c-di-AMP/oligoRNAs hydrolase)
MSEVYLFYQNSNLKAIFDDTKKLKQQTFHYILEYYVEQKIYKNKLEAGNKLKQKITNFYKDNVKFLEAHNIVWSIVNINTNQIEDSIKNNGYRTVYTKIKIKGKNCNKKDLYRDLAYLDLTSLYTK